MLIDLLYLKDKYKLDITGVLHIGAHQCEELIIYYKCGIDPNNVIWIEGNPTIAELMKKRNIPNVYNILVSDTEEIVDFIITNNGQSSSILELAEHKKEHPQVYEICRLKLKTTRLDNFFKNNDITINFNFINLDIQGAELKALKSMEIYFDKINYIYTEVNEKYLYENCALINEIDDYLSKFNFKRQETSMTTHGWGDAFYIKQL
jgi:FkbM family methyltransferase